MAHTQHTERVPWKAVALLLSGIVLGAGGGYWAGISMGDVTSLKSVRYDGGYRFINPPLYTEVPEDLAFPTYAPLKQKVRSVVNDALASKRATDVGVYFRDLDEGRWIGVNETHDFAPGSLLKVATLMTALRAVDADPSRLSYPLHLVFGDSYEAASQTYYPPEHPIVAGGTYTVDTLLTHLIVESDNRAADGLEYYFGVSELERTLNDLNVPMPSGPADEANSPQDYSHLFRALYNGTYLSRNMSEKALELLSRTAFKDGLVAGLPANTTVSHKWGERTLPPSAGSVNELHDCGIVYHPGHPYFLCVMTKGADFPVLANVIKDVSATVWDEVAQRAN